MQNNVDKLVAILNQDFGLMDDVHTQGKELHALQSINGQIYQMLMEVYKVEELHKIDDWVQNIMNDNNQEYKIEDNKRRHKFFEVGR